MVKTRRVKRSRSKRQISRKSKEIFLREVLKTKKPSYFLRRFLSSFNVLFIIQI
jgi:hypothetical protein